MVLPSPNRRIATDWTSFEGQMFVLVVLAPFCMMSHGDGGLETCFRHWMRAKSQSLGLLLGLRSEANFVEMPHSSCQKLAPKD